MAIWHMRRTEASASGFAGQHSVFPLGDILMPTSDLPHWGAQPSLRMHATPGPHAGSGGFLRSGQRRCAPCWGGSSCPQEKLKSPGCWPDGPRVRCRTVSTYSRHIYAPLPSVLRQIHTLLSAAGRRGHRHRPGPECGVVPAAAGGAQRGAPRSAGGPPGFPPRAAAGASRPRTSSTAGQQPLALATARPGLPGDPAQWLPVA